MEHKKQYYSVDKNINDRFFIVEGPVEPKRLNRFKFDSGLDAFRQPDEQFEALIEIAALPEGRIIIAREEDNIVGYITYVHPDPYERWSDGNLPYILELGAIEVSPSHRRFGLASEMLKLSFKDDNMEDYIVITTEYYWHWDLKNTRLDLYEYKDMLKRFMEQVGFEVYQTNDPEITSHPANTLMARVGRRIDNTQQIEFDKIRFKNRFFF